MLSFFTVISADYKEKVLVAMLIESILEPGNGALNEDFLFMEGNLFGVFDGATSLTPETYEHGHTGGFLAANLAAKAFMHHDEALVELAERANRSIRHAMLEREVDLDDKGSLWSTSAAVVRIRDGVLEWAQIGDCRIICLHDAGEYEILCKGSDQDVETLCLWKNVCQTTDAPIRVALHEQLLKVRAGMNRDYGVFNGDPEAMGFLDAGSRPLGDISQILLFTDGLLLPNPTPWQECDFAEHITLFRQGGLHGLRDHIRTVEATDPACRLYPRFKTHDDIAAIAVHV